MHLLPKFEYFEPKELSEACRLLTEMKASANIIAGGTDILVNMKNGYIAPPNLVSISRIDELSAVLPVKGGISIGANVIAAKLIESDVIRIRYPLLTKAAKVLGSPLIRNRATIGGNIVTARPAADLPPPLIAMDARITLKNRRREREIHLDSFFKGPGQVAIKPDEILTKITIDEAPPFTGGEYLKLMHRKALEIAIAAVATSITLEGQDGVIKKAKIILSAVAPKAIHASSAEKTLIGEKPSEGLFKKAAAIAATECTPIDDLRGGAQYRCAMVEVLTQRALIRSFEEARKNEGI